MTEPGWYPDYEDQARLRYHDGDRWTHHVHAARASTPSAEIHEPPVARPSDGLATPNSSESETTAPPIIPKVDPPWVRALSIAFIGAFCGLLLGGFFFNAVGAITPVSETTGTVRDIEIEYSSSSNATNRRSYVISGTTDDGQDWRITDETAYNVLQAEGYPQPVTLAIGDWTGTPERVTGRSFEVNHQTTGALVGWGATLAVLSAAAIAATVLIARHKRGGLVDAAMFAFFFFGPGSWLGFQMFQWIQSG